jgi:hypothetical protein
MGRRFVAGTGQLLLSTTGFVVVCGWFLRMIWQFYQLISDQNADPKIRYRTLGIGAAVFFASWVWAWFTSISLLREAKRDESAGRFIPNDPAPPRL